MRLHVVPHTHWDREWYKTAEAYRVHLLPLIDLALATDIPFLLDGQGIVLDDYLSWRPAARDALQHALRSGRFEAGPWYVLADNLIPSGEALVRNLLTGRAALGALGASPPHVLYCPDTFGHPALAPTLAAGFSLPMAMVWRGYGGRGWPSGDSARWRAADGSEVLLHHLPPSGYEFGASLPVDDMAATARGAELQKVLGERSRSGELLVLNGADHHAPAVEPSRTIEALRQAALPASVVTKGLGGFVEAQCRWAAAERLPAVVGELRASPSYVWALPGTLAARAAQKRDNALLERLLVARVEPLLALRHLRGGRDDHGTLAAVWRLLLQNHPHDTLCGCSIDDVARSMDDRARRVRHAATEVYLAAVQDLLAPARDADAPGTTAVAIVNPVPRARSGVVELTLDLPRVRVGVGPGSSSVRPTVAADTPLSVGELPLQPLHRETRFARDEHSQRYPRNWLAERVQVLAWAEALPPQGVRVESLGASATRRRVPQHCWVTRQGELNNGHLALWYDEEQGLCCASDGRMLTDLLRLESDGERGDLYTHSAIPGTRRIGRVLRKRVSLRGPLRSELQLTIRLPVAARTLHSATGATVAHREAFVDVLAHVQLDAGARWFRILLDGFNTHDDVRLRAVVRTGCTAAEHLADAGFGPVARRSSPPTPQPGDVELLPDTAPLHRYVTSFDAGRGYGVTVLSDGLAEYAASPHGDVAVTLLRAVGELSRSDLEERPGHAGWPEPTPLAQSHGPFTAGLAVCVHGLDTPATRTLIEHVAEDALIPARGHVVRDATVRRVDGPSLDGAGFRWLACKPAQEGDALIVRVANVTGQVQRLACAVPGLTRAWLARLDEAPTAALAANNNRVQLQVQPHAVITLRLEIALTS